MKLATGTISLVVPLGGEPSRTSATPSLSLIYSSGQGNGPCGMGWSLDLPRIARKTEKGLPGYGHDIPDTFILSGREDLVQAQRFDGQVWVIEQRTQGDFVVCRFAPRQEEAFDRIEHWRHATSGESFWTVTTKDNVCSAFGRTSASRIVDPANPSRVFAWLLSDSQDDRGNVVRYLYKAEDDGGVPDLACERNRRSGQPFAQRYLKSIEYCNAAPPVANGDIVSLFHFQIVLDYGEHDVVAPTPDETGQWLYRRDAFSDFRARFEVRTRRLLRRILLFHHLPSILGPAPVLTHATRLHYSENATGSLLQEIVAVGYDETGTPSERPALRFDYSTAAPDDGIRFLNSQSLSNLPNGVDGAASRFVDLYSEAAPGILWEDRGAWYFKRNLGGGQFGALQTVGMRPNWATAAEGAQLAHLDADGQLYAVAYQFNPGYAAREDDGQWGPFRPFTSDAGLDWSDPSLRHADLDGDGRADALILRDETIRWFRNHGRGGYEGEVLGWTGTDEERGPGRILQNNLEEIFLADMSGDGLADIVRIRNGEICYWPNLGYGQFGAKVQMDGAPLFDAADLFDPARLRLADIDGSGTTDLVYLGRAGTTYWINEAGNAWSDHHSLPVGFPRLDQLTSIDVVDLLGSGTACLVWSSRDPGDEPNSMRFIDLMGGSKPYLLTCMDNSAGGRTQITYAPSTTFYWHDAVAGQPWKTKLPFPVHVVKRVEHFDEVSGGHLASEYSYHHGFYDRSEREFRGFAAVDQLDVETASNLPPEHLPPVLTKTWFETGAWTDQGSVAGQLGQEYFAAARVLPDSFVEGAASARESREAHRALRGQVIHQEVYALDGSTDQDKPYSITAHRQLARRLQPAGTRERDYAVFLTHPIETLTQLLERRPDDARVLHDIVLDVDGLGNAVRSARVAYPRQVAKLPTAAALAPVAHAQATLLITLEEAGLAHVTTQAAWYRHSVPVWNAAFEVTGLTPRDAIFELGEIRKAMDTLTGFVASGSQPDGTPQKRLLSATMHLYRPDADADADPDGDDVLTANALPLGTFERRALPYSSYQLALTDELLAATFGDRLVTANVDLASEGYEARSFTTASINGQIFDFTGWWIASPLESFSPLGFYRVVKTRDAFGAVWKVDYDDAWLFPTVVTDPLGNSVHATYDYRHLQPSEITDANGNRRQAAYDAFGRTARIVVMGKAGSGEGDTLADPTEIFEYHEKEWSQSHRPNYAHAITRESHGDPSTRWHEARVYSDGFGRELATKSKVRAGPASYVDNNGQLATRYANPRWVGTGRTIYDNKGNVLRRYEPYFSLTEEHEEEDALRLWGVSATMRYDPLGRAIATQFPDLTLGRVTFDAWRQETWDRNDTLFPGSPWNKAALGNLTGSKNERARALAEAHAGTPSVAHLDPLGRPILTEEDAKDIATYKTLVVLDILGHQREVRDANGNRTVAQQYDMVGRVLHAISNDAGESFALAAPDGEPRHSWNPRQYYVRQDYDALRRPTLTRVLAPGSSAETLPERIVYGDALPGGATHNLVGEACLVFDRGGLTRVPDYDFKGNPLAHERFLFVAPTASADWSALPTDSQLAGWLAGSTLFEPPYRSQAAFDAQNRPVLERMPDGSETHLTYDEAGALLSVTSKNVPGLADDIAVIAEIAYDAKGQRHAIAYGNGIATFYTYDATTYRLLEILSTKAFARDADGTLFANTAQPDAVQRLLYTYDPVGNIVEIEDAAQDVLFNEGLIEPRRLYEHDPLYRLVSATGREHRSQTGDGEQTAAPQALAQFIPATSDMQALRSYTQTYAYDRIGNIKRMRHVSTAGNWTRDYVYDYECDALRITRAFGAQSHPGNSNRLYQTQIGGAGAPRLYEHDAAGNILALGNISATDWNLHDQPERMAIGTATAHYRYDAGGERLRKFVDKGNVAEERIYFGSYEIYRRWSGGALDLRRDSLHVMDDHRRVLLIETEKDASGAALAGKASVLRYQFDDHLHNAYLEADETGAPISYEEFHPYGTTALHWASRAISQKRYRYIGIERDEESGLAYHSARYYLPWLARWLNADPAGMVDGSNLYQYVRSRPLGFTDASGKQAVAEQPVEVPPVFSDYSALQTKAANDKFNRIMALQQKLDALINQGDAPLPGQCDFRLPSDRLAPYAKGEKRSALEGQLAHELEGVSLYEALVSGSPVGMPGTRTEATYDVGLAIYGKRFSLGRDTRQYFHPRESGRLEFFPFENLFPGPSLTESTLESLGSKALQNLFQKTVTKFVGVRPERLRTVTKMLTHVEMSVSKTGVDVGVSGKLGEHVKVSISTKNPDLKTKLNVAKKISLEASSSSFGATYSQEFKLPGSPKYLPKYSLKYKVSSDKKLTVKKEPSWK